MKCIAKLLLQTTLNTTNDHYYYNFRFKLWKCNIIIYKYYSIEIRYTLQIDFKGIFLLKLSILNLTHVNYDFQKRKSQRRSKIF